MGPGDVQGAIDLAKGFGTAAPIIGLLLYLWYTERSDRKEAEKENRELTKESLVLGANLKAVLERLIAKVGA